MATAKISVSNKGPWWIPIALALFSLLVSGYAGYNRNDKILAERVTRVETQIEGTNPRLDRIDAKIEKLDDKIDKVLSIVIRELQ